MAKIIDEKQDSKFNGNLTTRLLAYMKPYLKEMFICFSLVTAITVFELVRPILIGDVIDVYIEGYNIPYAIVDEIDDETIVYEDLYLKKNETSDSYAQMIYVQDEYYLFTDLDQNQSDILFEMSQEEISPVSIENEIITVQVGTSTLTGEKLNSEQCAILRDQDHKGIIRLSIQYAVLLLLSLVCTYFQTMTLQKTGQNIIFTIRQECFEHVHTLPLRYYDTHPVGRIVTRITNDVESLHEMYANILSRFFKNIIKIVGLTFVMLSFNTQLALYSFIMLPFILIFTVMFNVISRRVHRTLRTKISLLNTFLSENISGMKVIQIFAKEQKKYDEFYGKTDDLFKSRIKQLTVFAVFRPLLVLLSQVALAIVLYKGSQSVLDNVITIGTLYIFINYISSFFEPIQDLAEQFSTMQNAFASAEKIFTLLDEPNTITEIEEPVVLDQVLGKIEFKNVWFAYENEDYVLRDVSFTINPGEKVAFVGATGAGKSSILNLIGRYYDIQKGEILIDGVNIKDLDISSIRKAIGQVQQDVFLFTGTIRSNITLDDESITEEIMKDAALNVNAAHFIEQLPHGYDEPVSERGSTLSAGQRQLISFARTLAYDPSILVLDEATANIDTESELLIQDALEKLMDGRTTIMVAHRLSTIQHADKIMVMHKGKIREVGTHQELLAQNGIYKKLYDLQLASN